MSDPINGDDLLARIKPRLKEHRVQICLRPDLVQRHETLSAELAALQQKTPSARLAGGNSQVAESKRVAKELVDLEAEIEDASAWFTYRAMEAADFRALCSKHAPRKDDQFDLMSGYNREAVAEVLIRKCLIDPVFTTEGWKAFQAVCSPSEWNELRDGVFEANGGTVMPPKSLLASQLLSPKGNASA